MTVTSVDLAMDNYTQVEKLGARSVVHILAVLKPPRRDIVQVGNDPAQQSFYREITYPLGAGVPPNSENYQPAGMPRTKAYSHARQSEPIVSLVNPAQRKYTDPNEASKELNGIASAIQPISNLPEQSSGTTPQGNLAGPGSASPREPVAEVEARQNAPTRERLSERDLQATRTFAILPTLKPGDHPWDLGSRLLNFKTVMGMDVLDWWLPIRRSPCCNHEDAESCYQVGPSVDLLKSSVGFKAPQTSSMLVRRRRRKRKDHRRRKSEKADWLDGHGRSPQEDPSNGGNIPSSRPDPSIPMQDFNGASAASQPV